MKSVKKVVTFLIALLLFAVVHEGAHVVAASAFNEYKTFVVHPYGLEVVMQTPVENRAGIQWAIISGSANLLTVLFGYLLLPLVTRTANPRAFASAVGYWAALLALLADPLNLAIGPFIYGGDAMGVAVGLEIPVYAVQILALLVFLVNRELVAQKLLPAFDLETRHPLFRPWISLA